MKGFTLVEILVSIAIIVLTSGGSLIAFLNYRDRRTAQDDANAVVERLRTVQVKASAVEGPSACSSVANYQATLVNNQLTVVANCPGVGLVNLPDLVLTLANSSFVGSKTINFDSRTVSSNGGTVDICGNKNLYRVTVNQAANVSRPVYVGGC